MAEAMGFTQSGIEQLRTALHGHVASGAIAGAVAVLARGDDVRVEPVGALELGGSEPMRRDTLFRVLSMTKPVTAVAALMLVEEGVLSLGDPIARWLPEFARPRVLRHLGGAIDDTVPARRVIEVRDLLTYTAGFGLLMAPPDRYPIQSAIAAAGVGPGPDVPQFDGDEFIRRLAGLPLLNQPGAQWRYHTGSDVLGVLIERAAGQTLEQVMRERIFAPLGMRDTAFSVPADKRPRLAAGYCVDRERGGLIPYGPARDAWLRPPPFRSGGAGLVSTADDYLALGRMLLDGRRSDDRHRLLSRATIDLMTRDQLTPAQKSASPFYPGFWDKRGWGLGMAVFTDFDAAGFAPGSFGWDGGFGTSWYCDPQRDLVLVLMTQRLMTAPDSAHINAEFFRNAYRAILP